MFVYIFSTHLGNLGYVISMSGLACWDRSCSRDRRKTKKLIQEDYEDINIGTRFEIEFRYASMLFVVGVCFLYSSGMPILYPVAAGFFFAGYWADKIMLFYYFRKPIAYDSYMARKTQDWYRFILIMHILAGTLMYSNSSICPSRVVWEKAANSILDTVYTGWKVENFFQLHIVLFVGTLVLIALAYMTWAYVVKMILFCIRCCSADSANKLAENKFFESNYETDFYTCINYSTLESEL